MPFQRGNFAHDYAELLIDESRLPRGLDPEVTVRPYEVPGVPRTAKEIRIDRVDWENGIIYEIRPNNPEQIADMERQMPARLRAMDEQFPGRWPWRGRIVTYDKDRAVEVLIGEFGLTERQAQAILGEFGFEF